MFEDADDFQARLRRSGARCPGILPFWACCRLLLGQRTLQLHGNSLSPHFYWRDGLRSLTVRVSSHCQWPLAKKNGASIAQMGAGLDHEIRLDLEIGPITILYVLSWNMKP